MADRQYSKAPLKTGNAVQRPDVIAGEKLPFDEYNANVERINQPGIDNAHTTALTFVDYVIPPVHVQSGQLDYTFDFTDATIGSALFLRVDGDGSNVTFPAEATNMAITTTNGQRTSIALQLNQLTPSIEVEVRDLDATTTPGDTDPPIISFNPADGVIDIALDSTLQILSDEPIELVGGGEITDGAVVEGLIVVAEDNAGGTPIPFSAVIDINKTTITITPTSDLPANTNIYYDLAPVQDAAGNATTLATATVTTVADLQLVLDLEIDFGVVTAAVEGVPDGSPTNGSPLHTWTDQEGSYVFDYITFATSPNYDTSTPFSFSFAQTDRVQDAAGNTLIADVEADTEGTIIFVCRMPTANVVAPCLTFNDGTSNNQMIIGADLRVSTVTGSVVLEKRLGGSVTRLQSPAAGFTQGELIVGSISGDASSFECSLQGTIVTLSEEVGTNNGGWLGAFTGGTFTQVTIGNNDLRNGVSNITLVEYYSKKLSAGELGTVTAAIKTKYSIP